MWKSSLSLDKYQYARTNPHVVRIIGVIGVVATLLMAYGFWNFMKLSPLYILLFGPIILIFITNKVLRFLLQLFFQRFDIEKHEQFVAQFWAEHEEPSVDVFLPWAGEDLSMHEEVVRAVSRLNYSRLQVYMLDDVGSPEHKALAEKYGFNYLSRPNKGEYKKSGNLQYGYQNSSGEFVFILDADFIPIQDALHDLIPYIASNNETGILQTPQYFEQNNRVHGRSWIEFGGGNIVEEFYKIVMPCRDEFKAAMCVGTSAVYRRKTILSLEGTPKVHASEDLATGLKITQYGYYVKYLPLIVSMGKSPETFQGYFKQHMRWCSGNLVFAKYWPAAKLSLMGRLIYATNPLHYMSEALTVIFAFQLLMLLYFHHESLSLEHTLYFLPYIVLSRLILPRTKTNKNKIGTRLAALNNSYTYFYTYIRMMIKGVPAWHPSGVKFSGLHGDFVNSFNMGTAISAIYILCFLFVLSTRTSVFGNFNTYVVLGWSFYSVFWHVLYLSLLAQYIHPFRLSSAASRPAKAFAYVKTYSVLSLMILLIAISVPQAVVSLTNPQSPTMMAISGFMNNSSETNTIASVPEVIVSNVSVLEVEADERNEVSYSYLVARGDTIIELAEEAVEDFSQEEEIPLSEEQVGYSAHLIALWMEGSEIKPKDTITFERKAIMDSVEVAVKKVEY